MNDLMVDIETFGKSSQAPIVQIGAVYFDIKTGELFDVFKENVDARTAEKFGIVPDADTVYWWLERENKARRSLLAEPQIPYQEALYSFYIFARKAKRIWSHSTFDFVILNDALKKVGSPQLDFRKSRDIHTLIDLARIDDKGPREGIHHDALDDAKYQVAYCSRAYKKIRGSM